MPITIAIVDDKRPSRLSLSEKLSSTGEVKVLFTAEHGEDFLSQMKQSTNRPQLVLMDIEMPMLNGIEAVAIGSSLYPACKFLMLTVFDDDDKIFESIKAGSNGYLLKDEKPETILASIREIMEEGGAPMSPSIARKTLALLSRTDWPNEKRESVHSELSDREMEILKLLVDGLEYRAIAERLFIAPNTVRKHIGNIYERLHVNSKAQAIRLAVKKRWV
jgi:DNA-binding NarL/FixJ family response regulator